MAGHTRNHPVWGGGTQTKPEGKLALVPDLQPPGDAQPRSALLDTPQEGRDVYGSEACAGGASSWTLGHLGRWAVSLGMHRGCSRGFNGARGSVWQTPFCLWVWAQGLLFGVSFLTQRKRNSTIALPQEHTDGGTGGVILSF